MCSLLCAAFIGALLGILGNIYISKLNAYYAAVQDFNDKTLSFSCFFRKLIGDTEYGNVPEQYSEDVIKKFFYKYESEIILFSQYLSKKAKKKLTQLWEEEFYRTENVEGKSLSGSSPDFSKYLCTCKDDVKEIEARFNTLFENLSSLAFHCHYGLVIAYMLKMKRIRSCFFS